MAASRIDRRKRRRDVIVAGPLNSRHRSLKRRGSARV
jgi:hypothetical protein